MHTPALLDEASDGSPVSTLTPVYPLRFVERIHPWSSTSKWVDALGRTVFLALGSRQPKVADDLIDLKKSWDESDLDADEFSEWVSSFTLSGDFLDWCDDCGGPVFYTFIADGGAREVCKSCLYGNLSELLTYGEKTSHVFLIALGVAISDSSHIDVEIIQCL